MHDTYLMPCLLGCIECPDAMYHYVHCPHLYELNDFLFPENTSRDPLERFGLINCNVLNYRALVSTFDAYHAVRRWAKANTECIENNGVISGALLHRSWTVFAEAYVVSTRELSISCRRFSVPCFLNHLITKKHAFNSSIQVELKPAMMNEHCPFD